MRRLLSFLRPHLGLSLLALALGFLAVAGQIGLIGTSAYLISRAALRPSTILLLMVPIVGVQFFSLGRSSLRYLERLVSHDVTFRLLAGMRAWFFGRLDALPPAVLARFHSGDILSRAVHDIDSLQDFYLRALLPPGVLVLTSLLVYVVLRPIAPAIAALVAALLLLSGLPALLQAGRGRRYGEVELAKRAELGAAVADGVRGITELEAYGATGAYQTRLAETQHALMAAQRSQRSSASLGTALTGLVGSFAALAALALAVPLVRAGKMPGWDLAVVALLTLAAFETAAPMPQALQALGRCLEAGRRIFAVADLAEQPLAKRTSAAPQGASIEIRDLTVQYDAERGPALRSIDLYVPHGRHVAIVGPSGAGKTTLIGALTGLSPRIAGSVLIGGVQVEEIGREGVWAMSAVIAQDTWLFNVSLRENIRLGRPSATDEQVMAAAGAASLGPLIAVLPDGLDTVVGEDGARLSGGERQRVAIARAILKDAPILLLDEPTEGLDALTQEVVLEAMLRLGEGRTLLMVTHRLIGLEAMDEIVVLAAGRIVERGTHRELLARRGLYAELSALQADLVHEA